MKKENIQSGLMLEMLHPAVVAWSIVTMETHISPARIKFMGTSESCKTDHLCTPFLLDEIYWYWCIIKCFICFEQLKAFYEKYRIPTVTLSVSLYHVKNE